MTRTALRLTIAVILTAGLLAAPTAVTASDSGPGFEGAARIDGFLPEGMFRLSVKPSGGPPRIVKLLCSPDRGSHPAPEAACADLAEADGRVEAIQAESVACTKQYAPVTVTAIGAWHGGPRVYEKRFGNGCMAVGQTGGDVFDF